jgi:hypothetical protein
MFETIIALTSTTTRKINSDKFIKTFSSYNWDAVEIEVNCRPRKKNTGPFSTSFTNFNSSFNEMIPCKETPLESIRIEGIIGNSKLEVSCIFSEGNSSWFEAKVEGDNRNTLEIIEKQLTNIFKVK